MSAIDYRVAVEVGAGDMVGLAIEDPRAPRPIVLDVTGQHLELDYSEAGELFDRLGQALGIVTAAHGNSLAVAALIGVRAASSDTPGAP